MQFLDAVYDEHPKLVRLLSMNLLSLGVISVIGSSVSIADYCTAAKREPPRWAASLSLPGHELPIAKHPATGSHMRIADIVSRGRFLRVRHRAGITHFSPNVCFLIWFRGIILRWAMMDRLRRSHAPNGLPV